jgi:two-component system chemotaxis response regulator CheY
MPVMDGMSFIREVRAQPTYRFTPILMLTTESEQAKRAEAKAAGATGWLVKPVAPDQLLGVIKQVVPSA